MKMNYMRGLTLIAACLFSSCTQLVISKNQLPVVNLEKRTAPPKKSASLRVSYDWSSGERRPRRMDENLIFLRERYFEKIAANYFRQMNYLNVVSVGKQSSLDRYKANPSLDFDHDLSDYQIRIFISDRSFGRTTWNRFAEIITLGLVSEKLEAMLNMEVTVRSKDNGLIKRYRYSEKIYFEERGQCGWTCYASWEVFEKQFTIYSNMFNHFLRDFENDVLL